MKGGSYRRPGVRRRLKSHVLYRTHVTEKADAYFSEVGTNVLKFIFIKITSHTNIV